MYTFLQPFLGTGLLTSTGKKWHQRRRILTPGFHFNILQDFFGVFKDESKKLITVLNEESLNQNGTVLQSIMSKATLNTISGKNYSHVYQN